jgi:hypothetical protein
MNCSILQSVLLSVFVAHWSATAVAATESQESREPASRSLIVEPAQIIGEREGAPLYAKTIISRVYTIDQIFKSMEGPDSNDIVGLWDEQGPPELLWITGYRSDMVGADAVSESSPEFMCHSTMNITDGDAFAKRFPSKIGFKRMFTLDQGSAPVTLPPGFGFPIMSDQVMVFNSQVLNHNIQADPFEVRQKIFVEFVRDRDLEKPLIPLLQNGASGSVLVEGRDGHYGLKEGEAAHGEGCGMGLDAGHPEYVLGDGAGRKFSLFWVVPPGRQSDHMRITTLLNLPYDTTIHYATSHLHPFAESLELRDVTTGESVLINEATQTEKGIGLADVTHFSSADGIPIYRDHEYELVSTYNNTSGIDQDAMATMFLYLRAKDLYDFDFRPRKK